MHRDALLAALDALLQPRAFRDGQPNGLHVEGREEVRRVVLAVSAAERVFKAAAERGADAVLTHHGLLWGDAAPVVGPARRRLKALLDADLNLLSYHLPLDAHPEVGHNAVAARALGLERLEPFGAFDGQAIGWRGAFPQPLARAAFAQRLRLLYAQPPVLLGAGPEQVRTVGIVSGSGVPALEEAIALGLDAFVTGEGREHAFYTAEEGNIALALCGHHATERPGLLALGRWLEGHGIQVEFVDVDNPL